MPHSHTHPSDVLFDGFGDELVDQSFSPDREEPRTPTNSELQALALEPPDDLDVPKTMTSNDAFRIIEVIKEREAARRR